MLNNKKILVENDRKIHAEEDGAQLGDQIKRVTPVLKLPVARVLCFMFKFSNW